MRKLPSLSGASGIKTLSNEYGQETAVKSGIALVMTAILIVIFGLLMLYSTTSTVSGESMLIKQLIWIAIGIGAAAIVNITGYNAVLPLAKYLLVLTWALLVLVLFYKPINGAYRWIPLPGGFGNIQPSELAKITVVMYLACYIPRNQRSMTSSFKAFLFPAFMCLLTLALVLTGKDLGTTILIGSVIWIIFMISGVRLIILIPPLLFIMILPVLLKCWDKVRWARVTSFLNPEYYQQTIGYQLWLSILAMGSGSWTGLGFTKSRMKAQYLPEAHTDFILSIVGEELGFIAISILILLYIAFFCLGVFISMKARDKEGMLLGFGCSVMIALQAIINIGVVSGAFPTKGMPAPFISYGGSNIIVCILCAGFLLSISNPKKKQAAELGKGVKLNRN